MIFIKNVSFGKYLLHKAVHNWVEKFSQGFSKVAEDAQFSVEVAETAVRNFHTAGFDALVK
jgi:hypothetical protein